MGTLAWGYVTPFFLLRLQTREPGLVRISNPCSPPQEIVPAAPQRSTGRANPSPNRWFLFHLCLQLLCHSLGIRWHFACLAMVCGVLWEHLNAQVPRPQLRWVCRLEGRKGEDKP